MADRSRDKRSRGMASHSARPKAVPDSTPAAIRNPKDRIATGDHTPRSSAGVSRSFAAKPHTELRAAAVVADHSQMAAHSRLAGYSGATGRSPTTGHTRQTSDSR